MPGLGDRLAARVAGEIGEHIAQFTSPNGLQCYAGQAPVTRRSGKSDFVVARRLAHNRYLGDAVHQWAFCSLRQSGWAREYYDQKIAAGKSHHNALRALGNRWLEILWHCLIKGVLYDEACTWPTATARSASQPPTPPLPRPDQLENRQPAQRRRARPHGQGPALPDDSSCPGPAGSRGSMAGASRSRRDAQRP